MKVKIKLNRKGQAAIIGGMVALIVGIAVAFPIVFQQTRYSTYTYPTVNRSVTVTGVSQVLLPVSAWEVLNTSVTVYNTTSHAYTVPAGWYTLNQHNNTILWENTSFIGDDPTGVVYMDYSFRSTQYADDAATRNILRLMPVALAILLLIAAFGLI